MRTLFLILVFAAFFSQVVPGCGVEGQGLGSGEHGGEGGDVSAPDVCPQTVRLFDQVGQGLTSGCPPACLAPSISRSV